MSPRGETYPQRGRARNSQRVEFLSNGGAPRSSATTLARMRLVMSSLATVAAAVALTGCGDKDKDPVAESTPTPQVKVIQPGAPGEPSREVVATPTPEGGDGHTKADIEFMQGMIHHHQQAVVMTEWVPRPKPEHERAADGQAHRGLPGRRDGLHAQVAQEARRGPQRPLAPPHADAGHGQLTPAAKLKAAKGVEFDRLFLRYMTQHHQGALTMVQQLVDKRRRRRGRDRPVHPARGFRSVDRDQADGRGGQEALGRRAVAARRPQATAASSRG